MPALPVTQQSDWNHNVYVLTTIRVVVMILVGYLIKSLYNAVPSIWGWGARLTSAAAGRLTFPFHSGLCTRFVQTRWLTHSRQWIGVADSIGLENIVSDTAVPEAASAGPDLEIDPTLEVHPPMPIYNSQNHTERSRANVREQYQGMEASGQPATAQAMLEQERGLRNSDRHVEEGIDITVSNVRRDTSIESVADEEIGGTPAQSRGDAIRSSLDA